MASSPTDNSDRARVPTRWARAARAVEADVERQQSAQVERTEVPGVSSPAPPSQSQPSSPLPATKQMPSTPEETETKLRDDARYIADNDFATVIFLALKLGKPLLLEGVPGVGKTEAAKALASMLGRDLVRLQCYEGIDSAAALYEWNYPQQLLAMRRSDGDNIDLYGDEYLIERPLLQALRNASRTVLLIDEIDRSDHEFEAFLLEFLSDFQISIPETGVQRAAERPVVVLTSNRTRELHEALRRRCVYHWINYPAPQRESEIIMMRAGHVASRAARAVVSAVGELRDLPLAKPPGIAEAIDWSEGASLLAEQGAPWPEALRRSLGLALKDEEDLTFAEDQIESLLQRAVR